jgi:hypothetical protein
MVPIPKIWIPFALGVIAILVQGIATGEFDRVEISEAAAVGLYALIGWSVPDPNVVNSTGYQK